MVKSEIVCCSLIILNISFSISDDDLEFQMLMLHLPFYIMCIYNLYKFSSVRAIPIDMALACANTRAVYAFIASQGSYQCDLSTFRNAQVKKQIIMWYKVALFYCYVLFFLCFHWYYNHDGDKFLLSFISLSQHATNLFLLIYHFYSVSSKLLWKFVFHHHDR